MSIIKCLVTSSNVDDQAGYQLKTIELGDFHKLFEFLLNNEARSKIQKVVFQGPNESVTMVLESLVVKK